MLTSEQITKYRSLYESSCKFPNVELLLCDEYEDLLSHFIGAQNGILALVESLKKHNEWHREVSYEDRGYDPCDLCISMKNAIGLPEVVEAMKRKK
mgnify:CR=1 FL=1